MLKEFRGKKPVVGMGTYVSETALIIGDVRIGSNCYVGHGAILRGDYEIIEIGDEVVIEEGVIVHAPPDETCAIMRGAVIGHGAIVHAKVVGQYAVLGMGSIASIRSEIGEAAIVGEGAVVTFEQVIEPWTVYVGNPARRLREVTPEEHLFWRSVNRCYCQMARLYLEERP